VIPGIKSHRGHCIFSEIKYDPILHEKIVYVQARSSLYANTQLRAHRRAGKKIKSKKNMEDYQSQSPCRHAKTVLESFFALCVYTPMCTQLRVGV
jgi:hypothetical protein